jgi:hypothetical protein
MSPFSTSCFISSAMNGKIENMSASSKLKLLQSSLYLLAVYLLLYSWSHDCAFEVFTRCDLISLPPLNQRTRNILWTYSIHTLHGCFIFCYAVAARCLSLWMHSSPISVTFMNYEVYQKVPGLGKKRNAGLTRSKKHSFKNNACSQRDVTWQTDAKGLRKCDPGLPSHLLSLRQLQ